MRTHHLHKAFAFAVVGVVLVAAPVQADEPAQVPPAGPTFGEALSIAPGSAKAVAGALDGSVSVLTTEGLRDKAQTGILRIVRRRAGSRTFDPPEEIVRLPGASQAIFSTWTTFARDVAFARGAYGGEVVAWATGNDAGQVGFRFAVSNGTAFGAFEAVFLPDRMPAKPGNENIDGGSLGVAAAVAPDGTIALAGCEHDRRADASRAVFWVRRPGENGSWTTAGSCMRHVRLAADATGRIDALWSGSVTGDAPPRLIWTASLPPGKGSFGSPLAPLRPDARRRQQLGAADPSGGADG